MLTTPQFSAQIANCLSTNATTCSIISKRTLSLSLNLGKSGYLIINGKDSDRVDLVLKNGVLEYCSVIKYLGVKISDCGIIKKDVELFVEDKRANVTIKFGNFCRKNFLAPLDIKLDVLNTCVTASLLYSCETWGDSQFK